VKAVVLAGGTGGAKLAAGMQELLGDELTVIANSGDDTEALGVHVCPDPDLCTYWLSGEIDEARGWGLAGDSFHAFERLVALGAPDWFGLSDRDLALCLRRKSLLEDGRRLSEVQLELSRALGVRAAVLPMCDQPVRTHVRIAGGWCGLQEYLIKERSEPELLEIRLDGIEAASVGPEVEAALRGADAIVIGPSNPIISIGPILAVPGMRELLATLSAPVIAVSPFVAGEVVKGPTAKFMRAAGLEPSAFAVTELYGELIDGFVFDSADPGTPRWQLPALGVQTLMDGTDARRKLAAAVLELAASLSAEITFASDYRPQT